MRKRLYVMEGPDDKPVAFFPTDIVMVVPVSIPDGPTGLKDDKGVDIKPESKYRADLAGLVSGAVQQPIYVKGEVPKVASEINERLKWAEGDDSGPGKLLKMVPPEEEKE